MAQHFYVPDVVAELSTERVLASEWVAGVHIDRVAEMGQGVRDAVGTALLKLTLRELFLWRYMQTDPNWWVGREAAGQGRQGTMHGSACQPSLRPPPDPVRPTACAALPRRGNFLYDEASGRINLIDFGAAKDYPPHFVADYLEMVRACAERDRQQIIDRSTSLGFLTGGRTRSWGGGRGGCYIGGPALEHACCAGCVSRSAA